MFTTPALPLNLPGSRSGREIQGLILADEHPATGIIALTPVNNKCDTPVNVPLLFARISTIVSVVVCLLARINFSSSFPFTAPGRFGKKDGIGNAHVCTSLLLYFQYLPAQNRGGNLLTFLPVSFPLSKASTYQPTPEPPKTALMPHTPPHGPATPLPHT